MMKYSQEGFTLLEGIIFLFIVILLLAGVLFLLFKVRDAIM